MIDSKPYKPGCEIKPGMAVPEGMRRVALTVEYNGGDFRGFQKQASTPVTVQAALERAITYVANEPITTVCAGRTDAGVHASAQIVHFDTVAQRPEQAWVEGVNTKLPDGVRVLAGKEVPLDFHARFSAMSRTYHYVIYCGRVRPAVMAQFVTWIPFTPNVEAMQAAADYLVGEHDFSSFRSSQCQAQSPVRKLEYIRFRTDGAFIVMEIKASAFLHHMVRNIMGALFEVGRGAREPQWLQTLLLVKDRSQNAATAPPFGLYFVNALYPDQFGFSCDPLAPLFLR